jgi:hypothetical protein
MTYTVLRSDDGWHVHIFDGVCCIFTSGPYSTERLAHIAAPLVLWGMCPIGVQ